MSKWETFISRIPARIRMQSDAEQLLDADLPVIRRWRQRAELNPARTVCAREFQQKLDYERLSRRANVAQLRIKRARG